MKKVFLSAFITSFFILSACGGKQLSDERSDANVNSANANTSFPIENVNSLSADQAANSNLNKPNQRGIVNSNATPDPKAKQMEIAAPYNSTVATTMDKQGLFLETRAFKGDPTVLKIERTQENKKIKLYLKKGKIIELPYDNAVNLFLSGSPAEFLTLAGIKPPSTPVSKNPAKAEQLQKQILVKP